MVFSSDIKHLNVRTKEGKSVQMIALNEKLSDSDLESMNDSSSPARRITSQLEAHK